MNPTEPPSLPTWMLEHCTPGGSDASLRGDLLEEFRSGRSVAWYWRQTLAVLVLGCRRAVRIQGSALLFAALWSMLTPAWLRLVSELRLRLDFAGHLRQIDWPWSILCDMGLCLASVMLFIWAGAVLYLLPQLGIVRSLGMARLSRGFLWSVQIFIWAFGALVLLLVLFPARFADPPALTAFAEITDFRADSLVRRIPYLLTLLCALWPVTQRSMSGRNRTAA
jgi:hypothetical protein